ncbi:MAG: OmpH family outer membrane protein [Bacteroidetes bacterium]|nr:OmpH family outer membrane protein [Bacteroidota bacterium]MCL2303349.1 OmpH family outer membrane protein [Lentimicrobiaceae bacterium]
MNTDEFTVNDEVETVQPKPEKKSASCSVTGNALFNCALTASVIVLYILHFTAPKAPVFMPKEIVGEPGSGETVFVNLDTINEKYELVTILTGDIQAEMARQEAIFANKEKTFERKYNQFQENVNAGILTQVQMEHSQRQLMQEYQQLEADKERVFNDLQLRQAMALTQIYDSLQAAVRRINIERNASFVITYQNQSPFLLLTDPAKDITDYVLFELNRSYKYKK